jgi:hypothetical protein
MSEPDEEALFLDPSVFLGAEGFGWLLEVPREYRTRFVVSRTFFDQVAGRADYTATDEELWGPLPLGHARDDLEELLAGLTMFSEGDVAPEYVHPEVADVSARLRDMGSQVAVEEWLYLHTNSRLGSRTRKVFEHFRSAGAKAVEIAGNLGEDLAWLALGRKPNEQEPGTLTPRLLRKAGINVVIVGGIAAVGVLGNWWAAAGAFVVYMIQPLLAEPT